LSRVETYSGEQVAAAWTIALLSVAELVRLRYERPTYFFRDELMSEMLQVPFNEMQRINTVGDATFNNIVVYPVELPELTALDRDPFVNVCQALGLLSTDFDISGATDYTSLSVSLHPLDDTPRVIFDGWFQHKCILQYLSPDFERSGFYADWDLGLMRAENRADRYLVPISPNDFSIAAFMHYPQSTLIRDLPSSPSHALTNRTHHERLEGEINARGGDTISCGLTYPTARIANVNVNEYTNLHRQPDFSAPVIRQVPLGERVRAQRADNITIIGEARARQSCIDACQAFNRNAEDRAARDQAQQCILYDMIWYEITDARGNRGWVLRRYLEETQ